MKLQIMKLQCILPITFLAACTGSFTSGSTPPQYGSPPPASHGDVQPPSHGDVQPPNDAVGPPLAEPSYSLNQKRMMKRMQAAADKKMAAVNELCNLSIKVSFDWASFYHSNTINLSSGHGCKDQIHDIEQLCKKDEESAALIHAKVQELRCAYAPKEARNHQLVGTTIVESYWVREKEGEFYTQNSPSLEKWLGDNL